MNSKSTVSSSEVLRYLKLAERPGVCCLQQRQAPGVSVTRTHTHTHTPITHSPRGCVGFRLLLTWFVHFINVTKNKQHSKGAGSSLCTLKVFSTITMATHMNLARRCNIFFFFFFFFGQSHTIGQLFFQDSFWKPNFYSPSRDTEEEADFLDLDAWEWCWETELLEIGGRSKCVTSDSTCVVGSACRPAVAALLLDVAALMLLSGFSAPPASVFGLRVAAGGGAASRGLKSGPSRGSAAAFSLSLCARAVIVDKRLDGSADDMKDSVRRGIFLARLLLGCLLCCDCCFCFAAFRVSFRYFLEAGADCFGRRLTFGLRPFASLFFLPSPFSCSSSPLFSSCPAA